MGDKHANLDQALEILAADEHNQLVKVSDYIVTEPVGGVEQDDFLNGCGCYADIIYASTDFGSDWSH